MSTLKPFRFDHTRLIHGAKFFELINGRLYEFVVTETLVLKPQEDGMVAAEWVGQGAGNPEETQFRTIQGLEHYGPKIYFEDEIEEYNGRKFLTR